jgi:5-methylcytosine-specific restriction endonuclease McrA
MKVNNNWLGRHHTEESKEKIRLVRLGKKHSDATRLKMSKTRQGKFFASKEKISLGLKRYYINNPIVKEKMAERLKKYYSDNPVGIDLKKKISEKVKDYYFNNPVGIELRRKKSIMNSGEKSNSWRGGISFDPYSIDWTKTLRQAIRERDKYTCQVCGEKQGDYVFSVHHIDYNKLNCNQDNLITLCKKCHQKTNFNRNYWLKYFNVSFI